MGISQESSQYHTQDYGNDEELEEMFRRNVDSNVTNDVDENKTELNAYSVLMPLFKELMVVYQGNCTMGDLLADQNFFNKQIGVMKQRVNEKKMIPSNESNHFISSNVVCSKKRKSHGTKHM